MKKAYEVLCKCEGFIVKTFLVFMLGLVFLAAATRYAGYPINWSVDVSVCIFAWCTFLGGDVAMRNKKLMKVDMLIGMLSARNKKRIEILTLLIIMVFLAAMIGFGLWLSYTTRFRSFQGIPGFSYTWVTLSVPVGSILMMITAALQIREILEDPGKGSAPERCEGDVY
jgi:TRAP-type C4-dicarboxylate transport system permease small subunit